MITNANNPFFSCIQVDEEAAEEAEAEAEVEAEATTVQADADTALQSADPILIQATFRLVTHIIFRLGVRLLLVDSFYHMAKAKAKERTRLHLREDLISKAVIL